jgi:hypothetical protein
VIGSTRAVQAYANCESVEPRAYLRGATAAALTGALPLLPHVYREQLRAERAALRSASISPPAPPESLAVCAHSDAEGAAACNVIRGETGVAPT